MASPTIDMGSRATAPDNENRHAPSRSRIVAYGLGCFAPEMWVAVDGSGCEGEAAGSWGGWTSDSDTTRVWHEQALRCAAAVVVGHNGTMSDLAPETVSEQPQIKNDADLNRFVAVLAPHGEVGKLTYERSDDVMTITHTVVPPQWGGRGIAGLLAGAALDYARAQQLRVVPQCWFVGKFVDKHPEYEDLLIR